MDAAWKLQPKIPTIVYYIQYSYSVECSLDQKPQIVTFTSFNCQFSILTY